MLAIFFRLWGFVTPEEIPFVSKGKGSLLMIGQGVILPSLESVGAKISRVQSYDIGVEAIIRIELSMLLRIKSIITQLQASGNNNVKHLLSTCNNTLQ
ncbi:hypothetical protein SAY87_015024 [Trapa incisa]|uniref:Uncharacterized protein n=1 Tax=Trapa incisa TaxID=236973 RepID=A0AAN7GPF9_9MYRT|nr:hypothetical protein SAY87_015024 [Trapa incisa]